MIDTYIARSKRSVLDLIGSQVFTLDIDGQIVECRAKSLRGMKRIITNAINDGEWRNVTIQEGVIQ